MLQTFYAMKKTLFFIWSPKSNGHYFFFIGNFIILIWSGFTEVTYELIIGARTHMDSNNGIFYTCIFYVFPCQRLPQPSLLYQQWDGESESFYSGPAWLFYLDLASDPALHFGSSNPGLSSYKRDLIWTQPSRRAPLDFLVSCNERLLLLDIDSCVQSMSSAICLDSRILLHFFFGADSVCQVSHTSSQGSAVFVSVARLGPLVERGLFWLGRLYPLASLLPPPWRERRLVPHLRPASLSHCWDLNICCFSWLQMAHPLGGGVSCALLFFLGAICLWLPKELCSPSFKHFKGTIKQAVRSWSASALTLDSCIPSSVT